MANLLTALRLLCIAPCAWLMLEGAWWWAFALFIIAAVTDYFDGPLARSTGKATPAGGLFDHATDAAFVTVTLGTAAYIGLLNPWLPALIALAFVQYTLDSSSLRGKPLRASALGRYNGIAYFVLAGVVTGAMALNWQWLVRLVPWVAWLLVATTCISVADRLITLRSDR